MMKAYGFIHCHSDHSVKESPVTIHELCSKAQEMGVKALALTDYGTCTGVYEFMSECDRRNIKPLPGVEAYLGEYNGMFYTIVLLAKNYTGWQEIMKAVTESNKNIITGITGKGKKNYPVMSRTVMENCFVSGNVYALTTGDGSVASILGRNIEYDAKRKILVQCEAAEKDLEVLNEKIEGLQTAVKTIENKIKDLRVLADKDFDKKLKGLETLKDEGEHFYEVKERLYEEMAASNNAKVKVQELQGVLNGEKKELSKLKLSANARRRLLDKNNHLYARWKQRKTDAELYEEALEELMWLKKVFGNNLYVLFEYHGSDFEKKVIPILAQMADCNSINVAASTNIHITVPEQTEARAVMRSVQQKTWCPLLDSEKEMYMKDDNTLSAWLLKVLPEDIVQRAVSGTKKICDTCNVILPKEQHYPKYIENGQICSEPERILREKAYENIPMRYPDGFASYEKLEYELKIINEMGYAHYTLIVADYINYAKSLKNLHPSGIIYAVSPGRGSGAGSIVNYLLGITNIDPLRYGLMFERYLNPDRVSMPDIDTDFSLETVEKAAEYMINKYGRDCVAAIRTTIKQKAKESVHNAARVTGYELCPDDDAGHKKITLQGNAIADYITDEATIKECCNVIKNEYPDNISEIIVNRACAVENTITGLSIHAAGLVVSDGKPLCEYVPLLYNTSKQKWAVQYDMNETEASGLLKFDFLKLVNLDIITDCLRRIYKNTGKKIDPDRINYDDKRVFSEIYSTGNTGSVFQVESEGMRQMLMQLKPQSMEDIILAIAVYRPGPMKFIPDIIGNKHRSDGDITYPVTALKDILNSTYGYPVYQEQLIEIFSQCAGFSASEADIIRRYMSKKYTDKFMAYKDKFVEGLKESGAEEDAAIMLWNDVIDFSMYAFNKSHAAAYAVLSYITAYLKLYYPKEYFCAVLNYTESDKITGILDDCKRNGVKVLPPDINKSAATFEDYEEGIRYGLSKIKGVSSFADTLVEKRNTYGYFKSFGEYMFYVHENELQTKAFIKSGAFDAINRDRNALVSSIKDIVKKIGIYKKEAEKGSEKAGAVMNEILEYKSGESMQNNKLDELNREYDLLGGYFSAHPLENYSWLYKKVTPVYAYQEGKGYYAGIVKELKEIRRKKDGKEMAVFNLEDMTGRLQVICFCDEWIKYREIILENAIVKVYLSISSCEDNITASLISAESVKTKSMPVLISIKMEYDIGSVIEKYKQEQGHPVILHIQDTAEVRSIPCLVSGEIIGERAENMYIGVLNAP